MKCMKPSAYAETLTLNAMVYRGSAFIDRAIKLASHDGTSAQRKRH